MLKRASLLADGDDRKGLAQKLGISERTLYRKLKN
ncbi:helix-turn-helix domain-containing protein [Sulfuriferula sp. AH1]|nr:helix-turn-helix domain-containing protein [Sulfuriferula sp. AH1]